MWKNINRNSIFHEKHGVKPTSLNWPFLFRNPRESCVIASSEIDLDTLETDSVTQLTVSLKGDKNYQALSQISLVLWVTGINSAGPPADWANTPGIEL